MQVRPLFFVVRGREFAFFAGRARVCKGVARILIIDDDQEVVATLGLALQGAGHEVVLAADGREGMEKHSAKPADLIITDLFMPGQEGLETIQKLRKESPEVPIIAMSGADSANTMLNIASKMGAAKVLRKPFDIKELMDAIEEAL